MTMIIAAVISLIGAVSMSWALGTRGRTLGETAALTSRGAPAEGGGNRRGLTSGCRGIDGTL
jgi:hypothetical protein